MREDRSDPSRRGAPDTHLWWGVLPAATIVTTALLWPLGTSMVEALRACTGALDCSAVWGPDYAGTWLTTARLSLGSALLGLIFALGVCIALRSTPRAAAVVRRIALLATHFAGIPLALAFLLMFGAQGWWMHWWGWSPLALGQEATLWWAYSYFQSALAVVLLAGPVLGLPQRLLDASDLLGASRLRFWGQIGLPMLAPTLVETFALLVANAAAAHATPFALMGTSADVMAVRLATLITGDLFQDPRWVHVLSAALMTALVLVVWGGRWAHRAKHHA